MLVVLLPGYGDGYPSYTDQFGLGTQLDLYAGRFIQLLALGRTDTFGHQYWMAWGDWVGSCHPNATYSYFYDGLEDELTPNEAWELALQHCGPSRADVDYIRALVAATNASYNVDPGKIFALGQSNGAAMAYRLGCDASDLFSAIVPIAGAPPPASYECRPSNLVRLLHIHGTSDMIVQYNGTANVTSGVQTHKPTAFKTRAGPTTVSVHVTHYLRHAAPPAHNSSSYGFG